MSELQACYLNNECPDCGEDISVDAVFGDMCNNCGHVFCMLGEI